MIATNSTFVFVHGAQHTGACWHPTIAAMNQLRPATKCIAVDLPGHGDEPGNLATLTIAQCVDSVIARIRAANCERVVLIGHSMGGITIPGVATALGQEVVQRLIFIACSVPPDGKSLMDTLPFPLKLLARRAAARKAISPKMSPWLASWIFANGMTREQKDFMVNLMCPESAAVFAEPVDRSHLPAIPKAWILTLRDRAARPRIQRRFIAHLGGVDEVIEMDTCHDAMISEPHALAKILLAQTGLDHGTQ